MVSHKHLRGTSLGTQLPLKPFLKWLLVCRLNQFWLASFSLLQGRGKKGPQFYRPEGNRADWCVRLSSPHILIFFLKRTIKSLWAAFMWNLFFSLWTKEEEMRNRGPEAKASYAFCETAGKLCFGEFLPSQQCSGRREVNLLQHEMCSPKKEIRVQCFGVFHNRLLLYHGNRTVSCIFPGIKGKKLPLTLENILRPFTKLWRSQTLSRTICNQDLHKSSLENQRFSLCQLREIFFASPATLQPSCAMCNFSRFCVLKNIILQRSFQTHSG